MDTAGDRKVCGRCRATYRSGFGHCPRDGHRLEPAEVDPLVGSVLADRYRIEECVGEGAMSRVYRARHVRLSRCFAVKVLFGDIAADATMRLRFAKEAEAASRLDHPNVVPVLDFGESDEGLLFLAMDFVEGRSLAAILDQEGALCGERVRALAAGLCHGLQHAHDLGLIHRDFKPDNVVVVAGAGAAETPRILDFGLAISRAGSGDARLTRTGTVVGTPIYISPEQACARPVDHRADLFALGVVLYELCAGRPPFDGEPMEIVRQNALAAPPPIAVRSPGVTIAPALERLIVRLMAHDPDRRFSSAREVAEALEDAAPVAGVVVPGEARVSAPVILASSPRPDTGPHRSAAPVAAFAKTEMSAPVARRATCLSTPGELARGSRRPLLASLALLAVAGLVVMAPGEGGHGARAHAGLAAAVVAAGEGEAAMSIETAVSIETEAETAMSTETEAETAVSIETEAETAVSIETEAETAMSTETEAETAMSTETETDAETEAEAAAGVEAEAGVEVATGRATEAATRVAPRRVRARRAARRAPPVARARAVETISAVELTRRYRALGVAVDRLERELGARAAAPYRRRYFAIPYADALRVVELRDEVAAELAGLERALGDRGGQSPRVVDGRPK